VATAQTTKHRHGPKWHRRREEIIDLSASVMAKRGFHATSTTELCEANELGKGALYYYIGSKEELLAAIHDRVMDEVLAGAERVLSTEATPTELLTDLGVALIEVISRYPDHVWVFLHEFPALTGENATQFRASRRRYEAVVEQVLRDGIEVGEFRPLDARLTARAWLGMHNYTYLWLRPDGPLGADELAAGYADVFLNGVTA
jgi:AcrR family transcriptional regulator